MRQSAGLEEAGGSGAAGAAARNSGMSSEPSDNGAGVRRSSSGGVYQHTDYGSVPEDEDEAEAPSEVPPG